MFKSTLLATGAVALGLAFTLPHAQAQTAMTPRTTSPNTAPASDALPNGSLEKYHGELRASELVGANVYNSQGNSIGTVNDLLTGDDGKISSAVLSVGGFLGLGTHYVSVPFNELQIQPSRGSGMTADTAAPASGAMGGPATRMPGTTAMTTPAAPTATATSAPNPANAPVTAMSDRATQSNRYFSLVLPDATKDSLTKMPEFKYEG